MICRHLCKPDPWIFYFILLLISRVTPATTVAFVVYENIILFLLLNKWLWKDKWLYETIMQKKTIGRFAAHRFFTRFHLATVLIIPIIVKKQNKTKQNKTKLAFYRQQCKWYQSLSLASKDNKNLSHCSFIWNSNLTPPPPCWLHLYKHHVITYKGVIDI